MKKIRIETKIHRMMADLYTPVGIYLRLRDRFRDTILLESTDHHASDNSFSYICVNALAGTEIRQHEMEFKLPGTIAERVPFNRNDNLSELLQQFMNRFETGSAEPKAALPAQGLYGYTSFDMAEPGKPADHKKGILARYRLYQYVIAIDHFRDEIRICENCIAGIPSQANQLFALIRNRDLPLFPFSAEGSPQEHMHDEEFREMVRKGIRSCKRGDVFQVVVSRKFTQRFTGDEFNVYRALRTINPSPYLFFFDYGDYRLFGSSPEAQLVISDGVAIVHPIAGTFRRTGDDVLDRQKAAELEKDPKENAEHVMLVDLARNDLGMVCGNVQVERYKQVQFYSHVIHLVSEVRGDLPLAYNPFEVLFKTFPAGTLSGAPKHRALQLIAEWEPEPRGFYGGAIGFMGFNGHCNHAIMIRTMMSRENKLYMQAGAGVVAGSDPETELQEVNNKLNALQAAIRMAAEMK